MTPIDVDKVRMKVYYLEPRIKISCAFQNGLKIREVLNEVPNVTKKDLPTKAQAYQTNYARYKRKKLPSKLQKEKYYVNPDHVPSYLDQLAQEGYDRQVIFDAHPLSDSPTRNALLYLGPSGPSMPAFSKLSSELSDMMTGIVRGPVRDIASSLHSMHSGPKTPIMDRVGSALNKMMGGHIGDRSFDAFDFLPLVALIVATGLIFSGFFPNVGASTLGLTNGNLVIGRRRMDRGEDESLLDNALGS